MKRTSPLRCLAGWMTSLAFLATCTWATVHAGTAFIEDFQDATVGDDLEYPKYLILDGKFRIQADGDNRFAELPGAPLDRFGVMFGPSISDGVTVSAKIQGSRKRRLPAPLFGVGLNGGGGVRLQVNGTKKELQLLMGDETLATTEFPWQSGQWLHCKLQVRRAGEQWKATGKAWHAGHDEPDRWLIEHVLEDEPYAGRASIFGSPFSGTPIRYDDLRVDALPLGIQTWSLRNMNFDQVVDFCREHGLTKIQMIANHMDPKAPQEETERKKAILDQHGLQVYTFGVAGTSMDLEDNRKLFEFAKFMGIQVIVVEPRDFKILDQLEQLCREYDIRVAIHNHGIKSLYGNPLVVRNLIRHRDPRVGVCLDTGWITAAGFDANQVFQEYDGRVYDIHLKDKKRVKTEGDDVYLDVEIGTGDANLLSFFQTLNNVGYQGTMAIETDNATFARDPRPFVLKAVNYVHKNFP